MKKSLILAAIGGLAFAQPAAAQSWDAQQTEVWSYVASSWATHIEGSTWGDVLDPAGYGWNNAYPVPTSQAQMKARTRVFGKEGKILYYQIDPVKITVSGDTAIAYYYANIVENDHAGKRQTNVERCADTLIKRDGKWRFLGWNCSTKSSSDDD